MRSSKSWTWILQDQNHLELLQTLNLLSVLYFLPEVQNLSRTQSLFTPKQSPSPNPDWIL